MKFNTVQTTSILTVSLVMLASCQNKQNQEFKTAKPNILFILDIPEQTDPLPKQKK
jgi:hypothetical protein